MTPGTALLGGWGMCEKTLPPKEMDMTKSHVHFFWQVASIRIFSPAKINGSSVSGSITLVSDILEIKFDESKVYIIISSLHTRRRECSIDVWFYN